MEIRMFDQTSSSNDVSEWIVGNALETALANIGSRNYVMFVCEDNDFDTSNEVKAKYELVKPIFAPHILEEDDSISSRRLDGGIQVLLKNGSFLVFSSLNMTPDIFRGGIENELSHKSALIIAPKLSAEERKCFRVKHFVYIGKGQAEDIMMVSSEEIDKFDLGFFEDMWIGVKGESKMDVTCNYREFCLDNRIVPAVDYQGRVFGYVLNGFIKNFSNIVSLFKKVAQGTDDAFEVSYNKNEMSTTCYNCAKYGEECIRLGKTVFINKDCPCYPEYLVRRLNE